MEDGLTRQDDYMVYAILYAKIIGDITKENKVGVR
jgi:hypothetical protein